MFSSAAETSKSIALISDVSLEDRFPQRFAFVRELYKCSLEQLLYIPKHHMH